MTPEEQSRLKEIFAIASEMEGEERRRYLDEACAGNPEWRAEVEKLLAVADTGVDPLGGTSVGQLLFGHAAEPLTLAPGDLVGGRFHIVRHIGSGGMGEVYEAEDTELRTRVALKTLRARHLANAEFAARLRREIRLARRVTHANVCRIFDLGSGNAAGSGREVVYLTMELLEGRTLAEEMKNGRMPVEGAIPLIRQIASGLRALHDAQITHRDLKPSNVILVESPAAGGVRAVITDFGLAHPIDPAAGEESVTLAGQVLGTLTYAPPEQLTGKKVGPPGDLYSLGIVMYEMLCGRRPFEGGSALESVAEKLSKPPRPPVELAGLNPRWEGMLLRCLERDPGLRFHGVGELLEELEAIEAGRPAGAPPRPPRRWRRIAAIAAGVLVVLPVLAWMAGSPQSRRRLCRQWPGTEVFCALPPARDVAVFPFASSGESVADRALAAGLVRHVRESFPRLAPDPAQLCVHLRPDRQGEVLPLILEGEARAAGDWVTLRMSLRENAAADAEPLTLRRWERRWRRDDAGPMYVAPLEDLAAALQLDFPAREWSAWRAQAPRHPDSVVSYLEGLGHLDAADTGAAATALQHVIEPTRSFGFAAAHAALGEAWRRTDPPRGRAAFERAASLDRDFDFAAATLSLADMDAAAGDARTAADRFRRALAYRPLDQPVRKHVAAFHESAGDVNAALQVLVEGTRLTPRCWLAHNTLASLYSRQGRFRDAERSLLELVRLAPNSASAYNNLAFDYLHMGRFDEAVEMASQSIQIRPYPLTYSILGRAYQFRGCAADALVNLRKAVEMDSANYVLWLNLADGLFAAQPDSAEARNAAARALELSARILEKNPSEPLAASGSALALARLGRRQEALQRVERLLPSAGHATLLAMAETLEVAGERPRALAVLGRFLASSGDPAEAVASATFVHRRGVPAYAAFWRKHFPSGAPPQAAGGCPGWTAAGRGFKAATAAPAGDNKDAIKQ